MSRPSFYGLGSTTTRLSNVLQLLKLMNHVRIAATKYFKKEEERDEDREGKSGTVQSMK